jgi:SAM-dependent methyltransferase
MDVLGWIDRELHPRACTSEEFIYNDMDSQSGRCLPLIYQPFDVAQRSHWRDRGSLFDYLHSTGGGRLLDFGPGDGWPSLIVAPYVDEVVGVEGSHRRVEVCAENARRLGISNARFLYVEPGMPLPFPEGSFDGVMAASSVEQTPDPKATLCELCRVLRPGGRARIAYEALSRYRNGEEREVWLWEIDDATSRLMLYDRDIEGERARQYGLTMAMCGQEVKEVLGQGMDKGRALSFGMISIRLLEDIRSAITDALFCCLTHPSGSTLVSWLREVGFRQVIPSHSGAWFAGRMFDQILGEPRPNDIEGVDALLLPLVGIVTQMAAPVDMDPMITAVK